VTPKDKEKIQELSKQMVQTLLDKTHHEGVQWYWGLRKNNKPFFNQATQTHKDILERQITLWLENLAS
jgi:hypothetical protein